MRLCLNNMIRSYEESFHRLPPVLASLLLLALALLAGCGGSDPSQTSSKPPAAFDPSALELSDPDLIAGRETWMSTCTTCHLTGLTGAPKIADRSAWSPRIAKGLDTLYSHALNGFIGPDYTEMPPKGGFAELTDDQVKQAVRFMVHASK